MNRSFPRCFTNVCYRFLFHTFGLSLDWLIRDSYIESWFLYLSHHIYLLSLVSKWLFKTLSEFIIWEISISVILFLKNL